MLQAVPTNAIDVERLATGPDRVESAGISKPLITEAVSIIQAEPTILETPQDHSTMDPQNKFNPLLDSFVEVTDQNEHYEYEGLGDNPSVKGNLKRNVEFWKNIGSPQYILSVINEGYKIVFESMPSSTYLRNNKSALKHSEFVDEAIVELLDTGRIAECNEIPFMVNPLSVSVQPCGKKRLILDLRQLNNHLQKQKFKYEDHKTALNYFQLGVYMVSFDLKSGYHHIDIHRDFQCFLGFSWKFANSDRNHYFVFTVLPFGLSSAPFIFTKVLKPLERYWRLLGVNIALFLDDGLIIEYDHNSCKKVSERVRADLKNAGFITNDQKSIWEPCQSIQWLGIIWDSLRGSLSISDRRIYDIMKNIEAINEKKMKVSARELASFVGKIVSGGVVYGNLSRLMTRYCSITIAAASDWDSKFELDSFCQRELKFWEANVEHKNEHKISHNINLKSNYIVCSDASAMGCGAHVELNGEQICHQLWNDNERIQSSTWRELSAIEFSLRSFQKLIQGSYVKWFSDSQTACKIVEIGSMKPELHTIAIRIFQFCADNSIQLDIQWLPRSELERADYISRLIDIDDWQLSEGCFNEIEREWGPHTLDCFANYYNKKVPRFFSRFWNPECSGVDFFVQKLANENCLVVPPVFIIGRALNYLYAQHACATVVVPFWPSSYFWPVISRKFYHFIRGYKIFYGRDALVHGKNTNSLLGSGYFNGRVLALRMVFT